MLFPSPIYNSHSITTVYYAQSAKPIKVVKTQRVREDDGDDDMRPNKLSKNIIDFLLQDSPDWELCIEQQLTVVIEQTMFLQGISANENH